MKEDLTMKEMCETIVKADFLTKRDGTNPTAREIYEYSPTGELGNVFLWYQMAKLDAQVTSHNEESLENSPKISAGLMYKTAPPSQRLWWGRFSLDFRF